MYTLLNCKTIVIADYLVAACPAHPFSLSFTPKKIKGIHNMLCFLTELTDSSEVKLTLCYIAMAEQHIYRH